MGASEDNLGEAEFKKFHAMLLVLAEVEKNLKNAMEKVVLSKEF